MRDLTLTVRSKRTCVSCLFYPDDCGYWQGVNKRDKKKDKIHNCQEYELDYSRLKVRSV